MEYHILSNYDIVKIVVYGLIAMANLAPLFSYLASRDSVTDTKTIEKGLFLKIAPWLILLVFISDVVLLISYLFTYPWDIEAMPSQASIIREIHYMPTSIILFGWANDYQLTLLRSLSGSVLWFCWTIYAFKYKASATNWWQKTCKAIAYIIISIAIFGFFMHQFVDLVLYAIVIVVFIILLWIAKVKPIKNVTSLPIKTTNAPQESAIEKVNKINNPIRNEDVSRFMPKTNVNENLKETAPIDESIVTDQSDKADECTLKISESTMGEDFVTKSIFAKEEQSQVEVGQNEKRKMMYCKYCGKSIETDSAFCKYCGKKL